MALRKFKRYVRKQAKRAYGFAKKRYGTKGGIKRMAKDIAMLKTAINVEKKYWDRTQLVASDVTWGANAFVQSPWDGLAQGVGTNQRIGDQVKALFTSWRVWMALNNNTVTPAASFHVRFFVVLDTEPNLLQTPLDGATMTTSLLENVDTATNGIMSPYRVSSIGFLNTGLPGGRFKIIRDFKVRLDNLQCKERIINININHTKSRYKGQRIKYGADGNLADSRLYLVAMTDNTTAGYLSMVASSRVQYVDN